MDANGLRFWNLSARNHWAQSSIAAVSFDERRRVMRLSSERALPAPADTLAAFGEASSRLERVPASLDIFGTFAYWDSATRTVRAAGAVPGTTVIFTPNASEQPTDLAIGYDGVLYIAIAEGVTLVDLRQRFSARSVTLAGFNPWRLAADPAGGVWALDRVARRCARLTGLPLPERPFAEYAPQTVRPCPEEPNPPRLDVLPATWADIESPRALAVSPAGKVAILSWVPDADARLRLLEPQGELGAASGLAGARFPYSLAWVDDEHVAVMLAQEGLREAPVFPVADGPDPRRPVGDIYPLRDHDGGPFLHVVAGTPHYPQRTIISASGETEGTPPLDTPSFHPQPLHRLSLPVYAREGEIANAAIRADELDTGLIVDSEDTQTEWHRLYVEAAIPPHCAFTIDLAASDNLAPPPEPAAWHEHRFGETTAAASVSAANITAANIPRAAWVDMPSELPFHPGVLPCPHERNRAGLFTVLIQRAGLKVRTLSGRYLWVRVRFAGDGRATPEIAAIRCYGSRFSYLNQYLPELYRETEFGIEANTSHAATPSDFLERFLGNFESVLTPIEDRIAASYLLTTPQAAPDEALPWLGSWIGMSFDSNLSARGRRRMLAAAPTLYRKHGTLAGLELALDIATDGAVTRGAIAVLEDFRLRRTLVTILGADLSDDKDPLLPGLVVSGNSIVGDTLVLGEEERKEFLAIFAADLEVSEDEAEQIQRFFDRVAYRATILVHEKFSDQTLSLIRRIAELETPAHVATRVLKASYPLIVGIAALVRVDTYLREKPEPLPVEIERSNIGERDYLIYAPSLDPRLSGGRPAEGFDPDVRPIANAGPDQRVPFGGSFALDASASGAAPGRTLTRYVWERTE